MNRCRSGSCSELVLASGGVNRNTWYQVSVHDTGSGLRGRVLSADGQTVVYDMEVPGASFETASYGLRSFLWGGETRADWIETSCSALLIDGFEAGTGLWGSWPGAARLEATTDRAHGGSSSAHATTDIGMLVTEFSPISDGSVTLSWWINEAVDEANALVYAAIGQDISSTTANQFLVMVGLGSIDWGTWAAGTWSGGTLVENNQIDQWYKLSIRYDFSTSLLSFVVDDVVVHSLTQAVPSLSYVWIGDSGSCSGMGDCTVESVADGIYLDDVVLRHSPTLR